MILIHPVLILNFKHFFTLLFWTQVDVVVPFHSGELIQWFSYHFACKLMLMVDAVYDDTVRTSVAH